MLRLSLSKQKHLVFYSVKQLFHWQVYIPLYRFDELCLAKLLPGSIDSLGYSIGVEDDNIIPRQFEPVAAV